MCAKFRSTPRVYQLVVGASPGDAIYDHARMIHETLLGWRYFSRIYASYIHPSLAHIVPHYSRCHPRPDDIVLFHYSIGSELSAFVHHLSCIVALVYHNVTPPMYLDQVSHELGQSARRGVAELAEFKPKVKLALAVSEYNRQDLLAAGYAATGILPIALDEALYESVPSVSSLEQRYCDGMVNLLFVGRITPNKCQEDIIKTFYYYHKIQSDSRLFLVGQPWDPAGRYMRRLTDMVDYLGLRETVHFTGHVSFADMVTYYRLADVFLSMSEHEGFCKPLLESMYFDVPIVAYAAAAIPYTLGDAGVLIHQKDYPLIAALLDLMMCDQTLREQLLSTQRKRFQTFRQHVMTQALRVYLDQLST